MLYRIRKHKSKSSLNLEQTPFCYQGKARFSNSCAYDIGADQTDMNKLIGIGLFDKPFKEMFDNMSAPHHIDSARIGWYYNEGKIHLHTYCYVNGVKPHHNIAELMKYICTVELEQEFTWSLKINYDTKQYLFNINDSEVAIPFTHNKQKGYLLYPYFGGNISAPHTMDIYLNYNKTC